MKIILKWKESGFCNHIILNRKLLESPRIQWTNSNRKLKTALMQRKHNTADFISDYRENSDLRPDVSTIIIFSVYLA